MTETCEKRLADAFAFVQSDLPAALVEYRAIRDDAERAGDWSVSRHAGSLLVLQWQLVGVMKYKDFEILRFSDVEYEGMTVEVSWGGEPVAQLNMDQGAAAIEIRLLSSGDVSFALSDFLEAVEIARQYLAEYPDPIAPGVSGGAQEPRGGTVP